MNSDSGISSFLQSTDLLPIAFQFGPFLFALLFMLFITRTAKSWMCEANARSPSADEVEKKTLRTYFVSTYVFGLLLVVLSVSWWLYFQYEKHHVMEGVISDLRVNQYVYSDSIYLRAIQKQMPAGPSYQDYYFALVRTSPFRKGEKIQIKYWEIVAASGSGPAPEPRILEMELPDRYDLLARYVIQNDSGALRLVRAN